MSENIFLNVEEMLKEFASTLQLVRIYSVEHPRAQQAIKNFFAILTNILREESSISFGVIEGEIFYKERVFFNLQERLKDFVQILEDNNINTVSIYTPIYICTHNNKSCITSGYYFCRRGRSLCQGRIRIPYVR